jgi:hypothetical protein
MLIFLVVAILIGSWFWNLFSALCAAAIAVLLEWKRVKASIQTWRDNRAMAEKLRAVRAQVLAAESVVVSRVESTNVVEVPHDMGTVYLFEVSGGRWFWIDPERPCEKWPNSSFEVVRVPSCEFEFGPFCFGKRLKPADTLEFMEFDFDQLPLNGVYEGSLDSLRKRD